MTFGLQTAAYIAASVLFILALGGLSGQESAKRAVWYGIVGMVIAIVATVAMMAITIPTMPYHTARLALSCPDRPPSARMNRTEAAI